MINDTQHLEPRIVRLETGLELLTKNVNDLTSNITRFTDSIDTKLTALTLGLANAQAPRKTNWSLMLTLGFFILALGSAAFWPLNKTAQENKFEIQALTIKVEEHKSLDSHPVSAVLLKQLDLDLHNHIALNERELKEHDRKDEKEFGELESTLKQRIGKLEQYINCQDQADLAELRQRRLEDRKK